jgi:NifU-like protein involved in Fe-S cluster formation
VADRVASPRHAGTLDGAHAVGEARADGRLLVRIGLWSDGHGLVRARFRSTTCAALIAYADAACEALDPRRRWAFFAVNQVPVDANGEL